jgi:hypothetical protein
MIPVFNFDQVRIAWIEIQGEDFVLFGFMLYSDLDTPLVEYMRRGLAELDYLSGHECAIFVIESPSQAFIQHAKRYEHPWWKIFGSRVPRPAEYADGPVETDRRHDMTRTLLTSRDAVLVEVGDEQPVSLRHLIDPEYSVLYDRNEVWAVVQHFGLMPNEIPCIVFFEDLDDGDLTVVDLRDVRTVRQATHSFRSFFAGPDFKRILSEARKNA